jgi:5-methylcytosine-specific restriction protein A
VPYLPPHNNTKKYTRQNSYSRGYDNIWRAARKYHLQNYPLCADCLKEGKYVPMTDVHHIKKLADRPDLKYDSNNLMSLCKSCHSVRTKKGE